MMHQHTLPLLATVLVCCTAPHIAAAPAGSAIDITQGWKLRPGDDATWSKPSFDDTDWRTIRIGVPWEQQGLPNHDGYAWYRLHLRIPEGLRRTADFQLNQSLTLTLGAIDDVDRTWWNGKVVGKTGEFPEAYRSAWQRPRVYRIPADLIRWGKENVIAVRVYDGQAEGGMYQGPYRLAATTLGDLLSIDVSLGRGDGIFFDRNGLPIAATLRNRASVAAHRKVVWTITDDEGTSLASESAETAIPAGGSTDVACGFKPTAAGFYRVTCALQLAETGRTVSTSLILGYRPTEIRAPLTRQSDFDSFWQRTLASLAAVPPCYQLTRRPARDSATHRVFEVEMRSLGNVRVRGWFEQPRAAGKHPALLRVPGYGSSMQPTGRGDALAIFSFNPRGHGNSQMDITGTPQNYWIRGLDDKWGYFYQGAYADCVRAVDFLASRPQVDVRRIAVTGASQGGGLSLVTAALDRRVSLCAPDIPFLCDWVKYFKASHWPEMDAWIAAAPERSWPATLRTLSYFDALNFADRIRCPVFLGLGLQDATCPPATIFAVYNRITAPKQFRVYPQAKHWVGPGHEEERRRWITASFSCIAMRKIHRAQ